MTLRRGIGAALGAGALALAVWLPFGVKGSLVDTVTDFFKIATMALAWNLLGGYTGYPSFGNVVFFGLGAFGTGVMMVHFGWAFAPALLAGALVALAFALVLGLPILRLRGHYFALATLGAAEAMREVIKNLQIAGGNSGLVLPLINAPRLFYYLALVILLLSLVGMALLVRSRFGYGLVSVREDEEAAEVMGINTARYKLIAFGLSGLVTGLVGGLHAYQISFIDPHAGFNVLRTINMIVMSVIGGSSTVLGPLLGAGVIFTLSEYLARLSAHLQGLPVILFGGVIILTTVFLPRGLMDLLGGRRRFGLAYFLDNVRRHRI